MFEPDICGVAQAGIIEIIEGILAQYPEPTRSLLLQNVYVTGGFSQTEGVVPRIEKELKMVADVDTPVVVRYAEDPMLDPWRGAALFCRQQAENCWITLQDYREKGPAYIQEHSCSNINIKCPGVIKSQPAKRGRKRKYVK